MVKRATNLLSAREVILFSESLKKKTTTTKNHKNNTINSEFLSLATIASELLAF